MFSHGSVESDQQQLHTLIVTLRTSCRLETGSLAYKHAICAETISQFVLTLQLDQHSIGLDCGI